MCDNCKCKNDVSARTSDHITHLPCELRRTITMRLQTQEETDILAEKIHEQLVGNQDYIDSNIILNYTDDPCTIYIQITIECKNIPELKI